MRPATGREPGDGTPSRFRADDGRLRVGLRVAIVLVAVIVAAQLASAVGYLFEMPAAMGAAGVGMGLVAVGLFALLTGRLDRRDLRSYGMRIGRGWWVDLAAGATIGVVFAGVVLAVLLAGGWAEVIEIWSAGEAGPVWTGLAAAFVYYAAVAIWEELVFRGHLMSNAAEVLASRRPRTRAVLGAWLISIPVFAVGHADQFFGQGVPAGLSMWWWVAAGGLLGLAYAYTGQLALPMGLHLTLNYAGNHVFGLPGAELTGPASNVVRIAVDGPGWIVGTGGVAWFVGIAVAFVALWGWLRLRPEPVRVDGSIAARPGRDDEHRVDGGWRQPAPAARA